MRKIIATLALIIVCQVAFAQSIKALFKEFKEKEGADYISIPSLPLKFMHTFMKEDNDKSLYFLKGIKSVKVLDMEDCTPQTKADFIQRTNQLNLNEYETLVMAKEDGDNVKILAKMNNETIREFIILTTGEDNCALILLKGKFKKDDLDVMIADDKIMIDGRK